jgi:hypothetical protein
MLRGAIHLHSTYSDGEMTLAEVRAVYAAAGCSFVAMTDHAESFNLESLRRYIAECEELSGPDLVMIPGLEFACLNRMHILGIGAPVLATSKDPQEVIGHIERNGGISVIAHPLDSAFPWIESFTTLPGGIEVWNSKYDGRYAPRVGTFDLLSRLQAKRSDMRAFYGQDFHWRRQYRNLFVDVQATKPRREEIMTAFARGAYVGAKRYLRLPSSGRLTAAQRARFQEEHLRSERLRSLLKKAKGLVARWGMPVPPGVKAQLRRMF